MIDQSLDELLTECDREPIHIPGAIQAHGALLAVDRSVLRVTHASANLSAFLGAGPAVVLGQPVAMLLGEQVASLLNGLAQTRNANLAPWG